MLFASQYFNWSLHYYSTAQISAHRSQVIPSSNCSSSFCSEARLSSAIKIWPALLLLLLLCSSFVDFLQELAGSQDNPLAWSTLRLACPLVGLMPRINLSARLHIGPISIHTADQIHPLRGPQEYTRACAWKSEEPSFYRSEIFGPLCSALNCGPSRSIYGHYYYQPSAILSVLFVYDNARAGNL